MTTSQLAQATAVTQSLEAEHKHFRALFMQSLKESAIAA